MEYVAGFMFSYDGDNVALIRKNKPLWQAGRLNAIGGKMEESESAISAMVREFREETGKETSEEDWMPFCNLSGDGFVVYFFYSYGDLSELKTTTDEPIETWPVDIVRQYSPKIINLNWLIPMALSMNKERRDLRYQIEVYQDD